MTECTNENIHLFIKYMRGELHRKEERQVDSHVQSCQDCYFNFAYVEEIFRNRQKLSIDEKTLLFKYISDPIWQYEQNKLKQQIKQEILTELKLLNNIAISTGVSKNDTASPTGKIDRVNNSEINSSNTRKQSKESNDTNASLIRQNSQLAHRGYSIFIAVAFTIIFLSLSTSIYLIVKNQNLSLFTSSTISSSRVSPSPITTPSITIANNTNSINYTRNTFVDNNLYQQLDSAIDRYLESKGSYHLKQAQDIANDIERKYGDKYGVDLVAYYEAVPKSAIEKLLGCRKELKTLITKSNGDHYEEKLKRTQQVEQELLLLGNIIEAYHTKFFISKLYVKTLNFQSAKIIFEEGLKFSNSHNYILLKGYFLMWQSKYYSEVANYSEAQIGLEQAISIGTSLGVSELVVSSSMSLSAIYHLNNDDKKALELAQSVLIKPLSFTNEQLISLLQISGMSAFKLKFYILTDAYFNNAISLSQKINNSFFLGLSYTFLGTTLAERGKFAQADDYYTKALALTETIDDDISKMDLLSRVKGYQAKSKLLEGKFEASVQLYEETLKITQILKLENNLERSQLNEGLAISLQKLSNNTKAQEYLSIAKYY